MELCGELSGIGLRPLVDFLSDLRKNGKLVVRDDPWTGTIGLLEGRIVGAKFANEEGLTALDAIFFSLQRGSFEFKTTAYCEHNLTVQSEALAEHLDMLDREAQQLAEVVTSLSAIPGHCESIPEGEITLTRSSLTLLLALDGRRTVAEHARERGLLATLRELSELIQLGLVSMQTPTSGTGDTPTPPRATSSHTIGARLRTNPPATERTTAAPQRVNFWRRGL